jgi:hypothetical protein
MHYIYKYIRYPNNTQKQLIGKRVGISRHQAKVGILYDEQIVFREGQKLYPNKYSKNVQGLCLRIPMLIPWPPTMKLNSVR